MTQEEKDLLLRDLCSRLPYSVIGLYSWKGHESYNRELFGSLFDELEYSWGKLGSLRDPEPDSKFLPYLRPISSITEVERQEYALALCDELSINLYDWFNANHIDYRGLIPKGLALSTDKFNPYKD